ncbi:MAG TPA: hypothetical protein VLX32_13415 [Candidatus Acidoferrum sp.]|nr:hypothetical protein [Candidatus Eisenbacteria bacterium]HUI75942.1 hypothetical protein [Candidatus Acidoferrum sp.]
MKKITFAAPIIIAVGLLASPRAFAQATTPPSTTTADKSANTFDDQQITLLRKDVRSLKKQLIAVNLTLTDSQAASFWPVYEQYCADYDKINEARIAVVKDYSEGYGTLTDEQADRLIRRWLDTDISAAQLRQKYVPIFRKVLPGKIAATFFQLDRRISLMIDLQFTSKIPLVQSQE